MEQVEGVIIGVGIGGIELQKFIINEATLLGVLGEEGWPCFSLVLATSTRILSAPRRHSD